MKRLPALAAIACLALATVPSAALAQSAGDDQYVDPLAGAGGGSGSGRSSGSGGGGSGAGGSSAATGGSTAGGGSDSGSGSSGGGSDSGSGSGSGNGSQSGTGSGEGGDSGKRVAEGVTASASGMPSELPILVGAGALLLAGGLLLRWRFGARR